jgi:uncharacterized protein YndB with AHSA1/START domain
MVMDRIEKIVTLKAPVSRVWRALADSEEFGAWFGVKLHGPFKAGEVVRGTWADVPPADALYAEHARLGLEPAPVHFPGPNAVFCTVEHVLPERLLSFRWIPYGIDAGIDPATEPTTLVEFRLEPAGQGTKLTITESGFANVPVQRRRRAFLMNDGGWTEQAKRIEAYVARA